MLRLMTIRSGAALLRQVMLERGLSQRDVEVAVGAPHGGLVAKWLSPDKPRAPGLANAHKLESLYGIPTESWLDVDGGAMAHDSEPAHDSNAPQDLNTPLNTAGIPAECSNTASGADDSRALCTSCGKVA